MPRMKISILEALGIAAILLGPVIALFIDDERTIKLLSATIGLKDAAYLLLIFLLAAGILALRVLAKIYNAVSYDPFYKSAEYHYFYLEDGTVITRNRFDLVNGWHQSAVLPEENLLWYAPIPQDSIIYRLYQRGRFKDRRISSGDKAPQIDPINMQRMPGDDQNYRYMWQPRINPSLAPKEEISYIAEIITPGTEMEAFEARGTNFGFGLNVTCRRATVFAYAPFGYKFVLIEPRCSVRDSQTLAEIDSGRSVEPNVSPDGSMVTLVIKRPKVGERYWVHYRFEKVEV